MSKQQPRFPIYIPSRSRADSRLTVKALIKMGVDFRVVVEADQLDDYLAVIPEEQILIMDESYKDRYETCDKLGDKKTKGAGPKRNFIWDHAISEGHTHHWVMDDNIRCFRRYDRNEKIKCETPGFWIAMEDFMLRYKNVAMVGPNYCMFQPARQKGPPVIFNTRIYSCNLIRNDLPFRWRGRYNEDTILSLDVLKAGWCTILFNGMLQEKLATQLVKGGNTEDIYDKEGTLPKSRMLVDVHPDVTDLAWKYGRWHHTVNYGPFKSNILVKEDNVTAQAGANEFGMKLNRKEVAK